jgi:hypothetical protein
MGVEIREFINIGIYSPRHSIMYMKLASISLPLQTKSGSYLLS